MEFGAIPTSRKRTNNSLDYVFERQVRHGVPSMIQLNGLIAEPRKYVPVHHLSAKQKEDKRRREEKDERKRKYNIKWNGDVTAEDMEAYRMKKVHHHDPMKDFLNILLTYITYIKYG